MGRESTSGVPDWPWPRHPWWERQTPTRLIPRGCRVVHRRMGAPMVGFRYGPRISFRCPWLTLAPTSLVRTSSPDRGTWPNQVNRLNLRFNPKLTWTWPARFNANLTRTLPAHFNAKLTRTWPANFKRELDTHLTQTLRMFDRLETRPNLTERPPKPTSGSTNHATPPPPPPFNNRPTHPKPRPPGYRHGRGLEGRARTQIPLGAPCPMMTPTRPHGPYVLEIEGTGAIMSANHKRTYPSLHFLILSIKQNLSY